MRTLLIVAFTFFAGGGAFAQQLLYEYYATIDPQDRVNSRGVQLSGLGTFLQQDRANFHRFGRSSRSDGGDPFFGSQNARAQIPALYAAGGGSPEMERFVQRWGSAFVLVRIYGYNGRPTFLQVFQAAG